MIIYTAWTIPGIYPKMVRMMFKNKAPPHPRLRNTPSGGSKTAMRMSIKLYSVSVAMAVYVKNSAGFGYQGTYRDAGERWIYVFGTVLV